MTDKYVETIEYVNDNIYHTVRVLTTDAAGVTEIVNALQTDDADTVHSADLTPINDAINAIAFGGTNIAAIDNSATGTQIATAVNAIITALITAGIIVAP